MTDEPLDAAPDDEPLDPLPESEPETGFEPEAGFEPEPGFDIGAAEGPGDLAPGGRALPLRLARLHLRMGMLALARAELESSAGSGTLDEPALLDLAEVRWRTGDLAGAGEAADVAIGRGVEDPLAFVIAAEAVAGLGRPAEARRLAARALEATAGTLDAQFAGIPRSLIWPSEDAPAEAAPDGVPPPAPPRAATIVRRRQAQDPVAASAASAAAAEAFAGGRGALARADTATAALRLGIAIRLEPGFAQAVLAAIGDRSSTEPVLALVAGDALRLLGREHEALAAFDVARGRPPVTEGTALAEQEPAWPDD